MRVGMVSEAAGAASPGPRKPRVPRSKKKSGLARASVQAGQVPSAGATLNGAPLLSV